MKLLKCKGWVSIRWQGGNDADFFFAAFDKDSLINSFHHDSHCVMTGPLPSDSCANGIGPQIDRVEDIQLVAEGYDPTTNTSML